MIGWCEIERRLDELLESWVEDGRSQLDAHAESALRLTVAACARHEERHGEEARCCVLVLHPEDLRALEELATGREWPETTKIAVAPGCPGTTVRVDPHCEAPTIVEAKEVPV